MVILDTSYLLRGRSIWEIPCLKIVLGAGERFLVFIMMLKNLSTSVLEIGVLFHYGLIIDILWAPWLRFLGTGLSWILAWGEK
jgi:hypothetical protein